MEIINNSCTVVIESSTINIQTIKNEKQINNELTSNIYYLQFICNLFQLMRRRMGVLENLIENSKVLKSFVNLFFETNSTTSIISNSSCNDQSISIWTLCQIVIRSGLNVLSIINGNFDISLLLFQQRMKLYYKESISNIRYELHGMYHASIAEDGGFRYYCSDLNKQSAIEVLLLVLVVVILLFNDNY